MVRKILAMILLVIMTLSCTCVFAEDTAESGWWNVLLLGADSRNMTDYNGRTDCIMILSINEELGEAKLTSIMRDTWVSIPGKKNNKINAANVFGGPELALETVNNNFGTDIQNYILVNMSDFTDIVNLMGGADVEVTASERKTANMYIDEAENGFTNERFDNYDYTRISGEGMLHLSGVQAMGYCRDRYTDSDFQRVMRQQEVMLSMAKTAQNMTLEEILPIAETAKTYVQTNLTDEQVKALATAVMTVDPETVEQYRLPAEGAYKSGTFDGTWMIKADLEKNAQLLKEFIYE
ncbi:MAG: LCP family protein [Clostridia bacterium]|nr:LCP family protein [Clostridia bacterium]